VKGGKGGVVETIKKARWYLRRNDGKTKRGANSNVMLQTTFFLEKWHLENQLQGGGEASFKERKKNGCVFIGVEKRWRSPYEGCQFRRNEEGGKDRQEKTFCERGFLREK